MIRLFCQIQKEKEKSQHFFIATDLKRICMTAAHTSECSLCGWELAGDFLMEYIADGKDIAKCCQNQKFHFIQI